MPAVTTPFTAKPASASAELDELDDLFDRGILAELLGRQSITVTRMLRRDSYPRPLERLIDDLWTVVHVAVNNGWDGDRIRFYLLGRQPEFNYRRPAEKLRRGEVQSVIGAIETAAG